jgi:hypothetical protein
MERAGCDRGSQISSGVMPEPTNPLTPGCPNFRMDPNFRVDPQNGRKDIGLTARCQSQTRKRRLWLCKGIARQMTEPPPLLAPRSQPDPASTPDLNIGRLVVLAPSRARPWHARRQGHTPYSTCQLQAYTQCPAQHEGLLLQPTMNAKLISPIIRKGLSITSRDLELIIGRAAESLDCAVARSSE